MAPNPMVWNNASDSSERTIPSDATIYLSYILGDHTERANRIVLSRNEIKVRMQRVKNLRSGFLSLKLPENRPAYDEYVFHVRSMLQNGVKIKSEPIDNGENGDV